MSAPKIEIVNPIRFFSFFGLFLIFLFLAFRSCSEKPEGVKYVEANELSESQDTNLKKANSEELSDFITDIKKDLDKSEQVKGKDLTDEQLSALEDKNAQVAKSKRIEDQKKIELKRRADLAKKKARAKQNKISKAVSASKKNIIVKSQGGRLSPLSKLQLKQLILNAKTKSFSKIMIYGYYGLNQPKGKAFVKAAEIKNTLIELGVKRSVPIYMLTEKTRLPDAMGKVVFSK